VLGRSVTSKPIQSTKVNAANYNVSQGLVAFWSMAEGAGLPYDVVTGSQATLGAGSIVWATVPSGLGLKATQGVGPRIQLNHGLIDFSRNITVATWMFMNSYQATSPFISGLYYSPSAGGMILRFGDVSLAPGQIEFAYSANNKVNSVGSYATGAHVIATRVTSPNPQVNYSVWVDGQNVGNANVGPSAVDTRSQTTLMTDDTLARQPDGTCTAFAVWNRALSDQEMQFVGQNYGAIWPIFNPAITYQWKRSIAPVLDSRNYARIG